MTPRSLLLLLPRLALILFLATSLNAEVPPEITAILDRGELEKGLELLEAARREQPGDVDIRWTTVGLLMHLGKRERAVEVLEESTRSDPADLNLWMALGDIAQGLAEDGPGVVRTSDYVQYKPREESSEDAAKAFAKKYFTKAYRAYAKALERSPTLFPAMEGLFASGMESDHTEELRQHFDEMLVNGLEENLGWVHGRMAQIDSEFGQVEQAEAHARRAMDAAEGDAFAAGFLAEIEASRGNDAVAATWRAHQDFLSLRPEFLPLTFSPENLEALKTLSMATTPREEAIAAEIEAIPEDAADRETREEALENEQDALRAEKWARLEKRVADLMETDTKNSSQLLAALAYFHTAHGALEDGAFDALGARGEGDLIVALLRNSGSVCTYRGCSRALVAMRHPGAFELISPLLAQDTGMFPISAAEALGDLGDPRAVPMLAEMAEAEPPASSDGPFLRGFGAIRRREECIFALGKIDSIAANRTLAKLEKEKDIRGPVTAALLRKEATKKRWRRLRSWAQKAADEFELKDVIRYLDGTLPEEQIDVLKTIHKKRFPSEKKAS